MPSLARPDRGTYFMGIARAVRARADCTGLTVGAIIVHDWVHADADTQRQYEVLQARVAGGIDCLEMADPEASWASGTGAATGDVPDEHGHR